MDVGNDEGGGGLCASHRVLGVLEAVPIDEWSLYIETAISESC